ncbi:DUF3105 domain-containing protein [Solirubrobacter sp. CPCC 204708]|uniref:DUF3105 domain-containing protein n=1 Tax=Solirubrobacter deserti TaxID=2282478 RepID=A0ABT4RUX9_9ACTN|nr:DUF3105 domain-containing protein [Solirubrobacter deserti]MBE2315138.1 DUF3105 domain-containing protein [Solirubrobacter deserti]MDA0142389.1 DUF3105 domain-containing protein [Solirubrobacter deserti]
MKALYALAIAGLASGLCLLLIVVLAGRDSSQVESGAAAGPGVLEPDRGSGRTAGAGASPADRPPTSGPHRAEPVQADRTVLSDDQILEALALGNVVIAYEGEAPAAVQEEVSGPFDPELAAAGQAVILARRPGVGPPQALAWRRRLVASGPEDPRLREFAEAWLGQGAPSG